MTHIKFEQYEYFNKASYYLLTILSYCYHIMFFSRIEQVPKDVMEPTRLPGSYDRHVTAVPSTWLMIPELLEHGFICRLAEFFLLCSKREAAGGLSPALFPNPPSHIVDMCCRDTL